MLRLAAMPNGALCGAVVPAPHSAMLIFSVSFLDNSVYLDCLGRGASLGVLRLAAMPNEALCGAVVPAPHSAMVIFSVSFLDINSPHPLVQPTNLRTS